jgi:hypothetical protein
MPTFGRRQGAAPAAVDLPPGSFPAESLRSGDRRIVDAYRFLQFMVGLIAVLLPVVTVLVVSIYDEEELRGSISAYYYTRTGGYFVGSMCALGVIFASYRHHPRPDYVLDNRLSNAAGVLAVLVALIPTSSDPDPAVGSWIGRAIHLASAFVLLLILAYLSYYRFTRPKGSGHTTPKKRLQNQVYRLSGRIIVIGVLVIFLASAFDADPWLPLLSESIAVIAFGCAWLVKSEGPRPSVAPGPARA